MDSPTLSTKLNRIAEMAAKDKSMVFTTLFHHIDEGMLLEAYTLVRKDGATGVDRVNGEQYAVNLDEKLRELYRRLKGQRYRAPMVRRAYIPKAGGGKRERHRAV